MGVGVGVSLGRAIIPGSDLMALGTLSPGFVLLLILMADQAHSAGLRHCGQCRLDVAAGAGASQVCRQGMRSRRRGLVTTHAPCIGYMVVIVAVGANGAGRQCGPTLVASRALLRLVPLVVEGEFPLSR